MVDLCITIKKKAHIEVLVQILLLQELSFPLKSSNTTGFLFFKLNNHLCNRPIAACLLVLYRIARNFRMVENFAFFA